MSDKGRHKAAPLSLFIPFPCRSKILSTTCYMLKYCLIKNSFIGAWNFNIPVQGKFYFSEDYQKLLPVLIKKIENNKNFKSLVIEYKQKPNITLSKSKNKYIIK